MPHNALLNLVLLIYCSTKNWPPFFIMQTHSCQLSVSQSSKCVISVSRLTTATTVTQPKREREVRRRQSCISLVYRDIKNNKVWLLRNRSFHWLCVRMQQTAETWLSWKIPFSFMYASHVHLVSPYISFPFKLPDTGFTTTNSSLQKT